MQKEQETIGTRIRLARQRLGWYQPELARRMGVTAQSVQAWEANKAIPRQTRLTKLAGLLEVDAQWLLQGQSQAEDWDEDGDLGKISWEERRLLNICRDLSLEDQIRLLEHAASLRRAALIYRQRARAEQDAAEAAGGNGSGLKLVTRQPEDDANE